ncbi:hypothetical protein GCM10022403_009370 [Streptomyces coacervatus]|uniref:LPXTG cell wall anchor domain-containing protein n=1 Tax=Streptomyces coacervatus TaxID=647381 RepID=A0ABP7GXR1_9ACTN|nr:hypothetical protein [Streptomyces coacervatus]MDF2268294.1 hypothetical protein [Streptomyces coacervatus]
MRSARILLATAAASAVLAIGAPGAFASGGDWNNDDSSHDGSSHGKEHDWDHDHEAPHGGMHTGGGALTRVNDDGDWGGSRDPKTDPDTYRDDSWGRDHEHGRGSWGGGHDRPSGGMHTGGGALAEPAATGGGLAVLGVAAAGLYAARRRKPAVGMA